MVILRKYIGYIVQKYHGYRMNGTMLKLVGWTKMVMSLKGPLVGIA